jgi:hypothetical protein
METRDLAALSAVHPDQRGRAEHRSDDRTLALGTRELASLSAAQVTAQIAALSTAQP